MKYINVLSFFLFLSCSTADDSIFSENSTTPREWWISKVVKLLRRGDGIKSKQDLKKWSELNDNQIVEKLVNDPKFLDAVLDFNLFFLGFKDEFMWFKKDKISIAEFSARKNIFDQHVALNATRNFQNNQSIFAAFGSDAILARSAMEHAFEYNQATKILSLFSASESPIKRRNILKSEIENFEKSAKVFESSEVQKKASICKEFLPVVTNIFETLFKLGVTDDARTDFFKKIDDSRFKLRAFCLKSGGEEQVLPLENRQQLDGFTVNNRKIFRLLEKYLDENDLDKYFPQTFVDVKFLEKIPTESTQVKTQNELAGWRWLWNKMPNSSTNSNRKRAAYILKRFFCDDLTPINIVTDNKPHGENRHASDPSCQACHYKLDPMAGFFRYVDGSGIEHFTYDEKSEIRFSDGATKKIADYVKNWRASDGKWAIGYIRSSTDSTLNDYPDHPENPTFEDLLGIIRKAPEVKRCMVKRMFEYFVAQDQAVDPQYLETLASQYMQLESTQPSEAFKKTVATLVNSNTFKNPNPNSESCYDRAPGASEQSALPCKISYILERNCLTCHKGDGAKGDLDLSVWPWKGSKQTMQNILARMTTSDPELRMPLNRHISQVDRDALYLWLQTEIRK